MHLNIGKEQIVFIAILTGLFMLLLVNSHIEDLLRYSRDGLLSGEVWRIFSGHLIHLNSYHGALNILALVIIVYSMGSALSLSSWILYSALLAVLISLGLFIFSSHVLSYVGLSGVLHGMFSMSAVIFLFRESKFYGILLLGLLIKIIREQQPGFDIYHMSELIDGAVIVDGHLYGAIAGVLLAFFHLVLVRVRAGPKG